MGKRGTWKRHHLHDISYAMTAYQVNYTSTKLQWPKSIAVLGNDQLDALFLKVFIYASTFFEQQLLLETCRGINKYIKKECIKLVITQNCIKMHGQQNIKFIAVSITVPWTIEQGHPEIVSCGHNVFRNPIRNDKVITQTQTILLNTHTEMHYNFTGSAHIVAR
jgi:hypothetical protein